MISQNAHQWLAARLKQLTTHDSVCLRRLSVLQSASELHKMMTPLDLRMGADCRAHLQRIASPIGTTRRFIILSHTLGGFLRRLNEPLCGGFAA